jgi:hypothetical protein
MYNDLPSEGGNQALMGLVVMYPNKIGLDEAFARNKKRLP